MNSDKLFDIISLNIYSKIFNYDSYYYLNIYHKYYNNIITKTKLLDDYLKNITNHYKNINIDIIKKFNDSIIDIIYSRYISNISLYKKIIIDLNDYNNDNKINNSIYKYNKSISTKNNITNIINNINNHFIFPFVIYYNKINNKNLYISSKPDFFYPIKDNINSNIMTDNNEKLYEDHHKDNLDSLLYDKTNKNRLYYDNLISINNDNIEYSNEISYNKKYKCHQSEKASAFSAGAGALRHECHYRKQHKYIKIINFLNNISNKYRLFNIYTDDKLLYFSLYPSHIINKYYHNLRKVNLIIQYNKFQIIDNNEFILNRLNISYKSRCNILYGDNICDIYNDKYILSFIKDKPINIFNYHNISIYSKSNESIDCDNIIKIFKSYLDIDFVEEYYNYVSKQVSDLSLDDIDIKYCDNYNKNNNKIDNKYLDYDYIPEIKYNKSNKKQGVIGDQNIIKSSYNHNFINPLDNDFIKQKTNIYCLLNREILFPIRYIYNENDNEFIKQYEINNETNIIGMIAIKLFNYYDIYIFIIKNNDNTLTFITHDLFIINPKQSINNSYNWIVICLNIIKHYSKQLNKQLYIYKIKNKQNEYLFSYKSLDDISNYYNNIKNNNNKYEIENELNNLIEYDIDVIFSKRKLIFKQKSNIILTSNYHIINTISQTFNIYNSNKDKIIEYDTSFNILNYKDIITKYKSKFLLNPIIIPDYYISNFFNYSDIKLDERNVPYNFLNKNFILKKRFILYDKNLILFYLVKYYGLYMKDILCLSYDYGIIEPLLYYNKNIKLQHIHYKNDLYNNILNNKIKTFYKFNDIEYHDDIYKQTDIIYNTIFIDATHYILFKDNIDNYITIENNNLYLLKIAYKMINNLNIEGNMYIYMKQTILNKETLEQINKISNNFEILDIISYNYNPFIDFNLILIFKKKLRKEKNIIKKDYINKNIMTNIIKYYEKLINDIIFTNNSVLYTETITKNNINDLFNQFNYLSNNDYIKSQINKNLYISYQLAKFLDFEIYEIENINKTLLLSFEKMYSYEKPLLIKIKSNIKTNKIDIKLNNDIKILDQIRIYNNIIHNTNYNIDYRPINVWDYVKKFIRFYESTLNKDILQYGINNNNKPVSRAWIKFYEILYHSKILKKYAFGDNELNTFHICEAPGNFIHCLIYFIKKHHSNLKLNWHATTLVPSDNSNIGFGDEYGFIKKYKDQWSYGEDKTGDITKEINIKYYNEKCKNTDIMIGDCGVPWSEDNTLAIKLYYSQILFILYNLKKNGDCIFKHIQLFDHKIFIDLFYILYLCFDKVILFKPTQNMFSNEFYVICYNYNNTLLLSNHFKILFDILNKDIKNISIIDKDYDKDFIYQFTNSLNVISSNYVNNIERQLYYTDFWHTITDNDKDDIKKYIDIKNKQWIQKYLLKK